MQAKMSSQQDLANCVSNQSVAMLLRSQQTQIHPIKPQ